MKIRKYLFLGLATIMLLTGCGSKETASGEEKVTENNTKIEATVGINGEVEVDLTTMSSKMVYAVVYNMVNSPDVYIGKTIRISGEYYSSYYEDTKLNYHFVIISDATSCCQSGIEFKVNDEKYKYPNTGENIEVTGIFNSFEELGETYYYISTESVTVL